METSYVVAGKTYVINAEFNKLSAEDKSKLFSELTAPVEFIDLEPKMLTKGYIIDRVTSGTFSSKDAFVCKLMDLDVDEELVHKIVTLTSELDSAKKLLKSSLVTDEGYSFFTEYDPNFKLEYKLGATKITSGSYNSITLPVAKKIWDEYARIMTAHQQGVTPENCISRFTHYEGKYVDYSLMPSSYNRTVKLRAELGKLDKSIVKVGCKNLDVAKMEHIARHYGWY